ncbi:hypothetical protein FRB99_008551 [Tulasnella sp. 403]|nr:hypothetical protein FRB99_008551 [Tulasnella sp. 403]
MRKAKATPLSIRFLPLGLGFTRHERLRAISTHAQRLKSLAVVDYDMSSVVDHLALPLPSLEELYLGNSTSEAQETPSRFRGGPNLLVIRLQGISFGWSDANISNLTVLEIKGVHETPTFCAGLITALTLCPKLQELVIDTNPATGVPKEDLSIQILLPLLTTLKIHSTGLSRLPSLIFGSVNAKKVQNLLVTVKEGMDSPTAGHARLVGLRGGYNYLSTVISNAWRWDRLTMKCSDGLFSVSDPGGGALAVSIPSGSSHMEAILTSPTLGTLLLPLELDLSSWGPKELPGVFIPNIKTLTKLTVKAAPNSALTDNILTALAQPIRASGGALMWPCPNLAHLHIQGTPPPRNPFGNSGWGTTSQVSVASPKVNRMEEVVHIRACQMFLQAKGQNKSPWSGPGDDKKGQGSSNAQFYLDVVPNIVIHSEPHGREFNAAKVRFTM